MNNNRINISIDEEHLGALDSLAKQLKISRSSLIKLMIENPDTNKLADEAQLRKRTYPGATSHNVHCVNKTCVRNFLTKNGFIFIDPDGLPAKTLIKHILLMLDEWSYDAKTFFYQFPEIEI